MAALDGVISLSTVPSAITVGFIRASGRGGPGSCISLIVRRQLCVQQIPIVDDWFHGRRRLLENGSFSLRRRCPAQNHMNDKERHQSPAEAEY